jgi:uncharacterized protein YfaS (alpha-2-macroglobulin family)
MTARLKLVIAALVVMLAVASGWWWSASGRPDAAPSRVVVGSAQAFALADCKARLFDGSPAIAVMFTQPLARSQDWDKLVKATEGDSPESAKPVSARWVLGDNPRMLYLPFVTPERHYRIELASTLAAADSANLGASQRCEAKSEAMPVSFYFASRGVVLPAGQNGGLPVVTVNTPEVDVQFLRVQPSALPTFMEQVSGRRERRPVQSSDGDEGDGGYDYSGNERRLKGTVSGWQLDQLRESATSVYLGRFATDARSNRRNVSFLPVEGIKELHEPGIYIAVMNPPGRFGWDYQVTYFYVTDIGLHIRRHSAQTDVFATSLKSGEAMGGIEVSLLDEAGKALAQARSDREGHAVFEGHVDKARVVMARRGQEMSVIALREPALDLSEYDVGGNPSRNQKLLVYAGRDLYRPGEQFSVSVLARDADGKPLPVPAGVDAPPLTLALKKPDGERELTLLVRPHAAGTAYYQQVLTLPADAPTGRWLLEARIDPAVKRADAQWSFKVEEFLPERMKLELKAADGPLQGTTAMAVSVDGSYLYGAPAAGNRLLGSASSERERIALPQAWPGFVFGDVDDDSARRRQDLREATLDAAGRTTVHVPVDMAQRKSPMKLRASFSLLESGGRPVVRSIERTWWPAPVLVGVRPLFDRDVAQEGGLAEFELVRVDAAGKFVAAKEVQIKLVHEDRRWYWRYDDNRGWNSGYHVEEELSEARSVALGARTKIALPVRWGRYRLDVLDPQTQQTARYRFYAGWGAQDADDIGNRPDRVQLKLEGAPFNAGDTARLTITPPHDGEALLTVEGDRVLYRRRVDVRTAGTTVTIPIDAAWNRHDLYIGVVAFRPGSQGDRVTPTRALGLVHLPLSRESRKLKLSLSAPAKAAPERSVPVKLKLSDAAGKPVSDRRAIVTLSAVDVGILNITNYATPDPQAYFFGKHRYDADVLDLYGKLIEKMDGGVAKQRFGGDAGKRDTKSMPRKVRLVDLFSGPVALDANGEATIPLALPDFNGTLRLMAVASTADSYANAAAEMTVAAPIVAELAMPRFIAPGDSATIALDVTNLSGSAQDVSVKVEAGAPLKISGTAGPLKLADKQRSVLRYTVEATDAYGLAPIKLTVSAGALKLVREAALQVQPATPLVREVRRVRVDSDGVFKLDSRQADGLWAGSTTVNLTLSNKPPIDVRDAVQGLLMYPYGCLEQTTSSAYPLVFIDEAAATAFRMTPLSREERARRLDVAFGRLAGMQQPQGGFGLWSSSSPYEAWLSAYVTGFLQDARAAGFAVPESLEKRAMASLLEQFQRAPGFQTKLPKEVRRDAQGRVADYREAELIRLAHQRFAEAAHVGYMLAREQKAPLATLRTLHDDYRANARSPLALVHLGLAMKLMGDETRAKQAFDDAMQLAYGIQPADTVGWGGEWLGDYGSRIRDQALAYALMQRHQIAHPRRENLLLDLAGEFDRHRYFSTQERLALFLAARAAGGDADQAWSALLQAGAQSETISSKGNEQRSFDVATLKRGITLSSKSAQPLFVEVAVQGHAVKPLPPRADRIAVERSWWTTDGKAMSERRAFTTGEMLIVRLRVSASQRVKDALIVDRIPAGVEVENLNLSQGAQAGEFKVENLSIAEAMNNERIKHKEYRDDRFVVAADLDGRALDLFYLVRVVTPGRFVVPAPFAEDMYRPDLRAVGKAEADIVVTDPRSK